MHGLAPACLDRCRPLKQRLDDSAPGRVRGHADSISAGYGSDAVHENGNRSVGVVRTVKDMTSDTPLPPLFHLSVN